MSYGKVEMRAKLPTGYWIWPALWMMGVNGAWPQCGEIDIMELVGGGKEDSKLYGTLHWTADYEESGRHFVKGVEFYNKNNVSLGDDYHTYGLEWEQNQLRIYFDGMQSLSASIRPVRSGISTTRPRKALSKIRSLRICAITAA